MRLTKPELAYHCVVVVIGVVLGALTLLSACGKAHSDSGVTITEQIGPDGSNCYVFWQGATAVGGNCK